MDQPTHYLTEIKKYVGVIRDKITIHRIVLFGSYAKGTATVESDIDMAVISSNFGNPPHLTRWIYPNGNMMPTSVLRFSRSPSRPSKSRATTSSR